MHLPEQRRLTGCAVERRSNGDRRKHDAEGNSEQRHDREVDSDRLLRLLFVGETLEEKRNGASCLSLRFVFWTLSTAKGLFY